MLLLEYLLLNSDSSSFGGGLSGLLWSLNVHLILKLAVGGPGGLLLVIVGGIGGLLLVSSRTIILNRTKIQDSASPGS